MSEHQRYSSDLLSASKQDSYYALTMFPYPSWSWLHCGHASIFTINDVLARYKRMQWFKVLNPFWFDAFWLPTENYAIQQGKPARQVTDENKQHFLNQVQALNMSFDMSRIIDTSEPEYYKRTQWIFSKLYEAWLVYKDTLWVNRCPEDQTVLANDQVVDGKCERCKSEIIQKKHPQRFIKITDYADRLIQDLETIDRPEETKVAQRNRIGRSEGAEIDFKVLSENSKSPDNGDHLENTVQYYNTHAKKYFDKNHDIHQWLANIYSTLLNNLDQNVSILELWSWTWRDANYIESLWYTVRRSDFSDGFINLQREQWKNIEKINAIEFTLNESFDLIIANAVLVHFDENQIKSSLASIKNHLHRNWLFFFSFRSHSSENAHTQKSGDTRFFNVPDLELINKLLAKFWFKVEEYQTNNEDDWEKVYTWHSYTCRYIWTDQITQTHSNTTDKTITCFTTRADTIYGVTALVLAPENTELDAVMDDDHRKEILAYRQATLSKTSVQRQQDLKEKTWVNSGLFALHPLTHQPIPIWYADYVLAEYWSGAVMSVPAHDQRDYEFAKKFDLDIKHVVAFHYESWNTPVPGKEVVERENVLALVKHRENDTFALLDWSKSQDFKTMIMWWVDEWESYLEAAKREIIEEIWYDDFAYISQIWWEIHAEYFAAHKDQNRYSKEQCYYFELQSWRIWNDNPDDEHHDLHWISRDKALEFLSDIPWESSHVEFRKRFMNWSNVYSGSWVLINSEEYTWLSHIDGQRKIIEYLESAGIWRRKITYKLRDRSVSRQRYRWSPVPVWYDEQWNDHLVPESELPVILPLDLENYKPSGKSPLEDHPEFPKYKDLWTRECDTLDTFMCSSFYFLRFPDANNPDELIRKELAAKLLPVDFYSWGKEHTVGHLLYSRFIHKFLFDQWFVDSAEPFKKLIHQWMVLGADGRKMWKRYNNWVDPLDVVEKYNADAVRTYLMFMWPVEADKPWSDTSLNWVAKFLKRIDALLTGDYRWIENENVESLLHETIQWITYDIEHMKLNTCVSKLMILVNTMYEHKAVTDSQLAILAQLLAPFATELAEKIRVEVDGKWDVHYSARPLADESKIQASSITLPIQINGKVRAKIEITPGLTEDEVMHLATAQENIIKRIEWKEIKKMIWVQDKILNIIVI